MTGPGVAGATRSRRALFGVGDQVLSSGTNYLTAFVASFVLSPERFGGFVVAYAVVTVVAAATRAFLSEPLLAHLPTVASASRRAQLAGSALAASALVGVVGSVLLFALGLAGGALTTLLAFVPWLTGALVADAGRYVLLSRSETGRTFAVDAAWALAQGGALVVVAVTGAWSPSTIAASWGVGALAAVATLLVVGADRPRRPMEWLREGRYLSGWFTVVSVVGQVQMYAVLLIAGAVLATQEMAGLRAVQLLVYQPPTTFMAAVLVLATPMFARLAVQPDRAPFLRLRRAAVAAMAVLGLVVLAAIPLRHVLLDLLFPRYTDFAPLVAPLAVQVVVGGLGVPFAASLRGMRRGRELFATQVVTAVGLVVGAVVGLTFGGVLGLAWGMAAGAVVSVGVEIVVAVRARPVDGPGVVAGGRVIWIGPMPPPLHGASMITARFLAQVVDRVGVERVDLVSVAGGGSGWRHHRARALAHLRAAVRVALAPAGTVVYVSLSGGLGLWYQWPVVALARLRRLPVVVHHHSWAYVSAASAVMAVIARLLGPRDRHLFLSELMRDGYLARYATGAAAEVVSNAHFIEAGAVGDVGRAGAALRLVHVSNLSVAKGSLAAIRTHEELRRRGVASTLRLIGPCGDASILDAVEAAGDAVRWLGPRSSDEIYEELAGADAFLFPSSYANEAEPLVVLEALSRGVPVIATRRGTLPDLLPPDWLVGEPDPVALADRVEALRSSADPAGERRRARAVFDGLRRHDDPVDLVLAPASVAVPVR